MASAEISGNSIRNNCVATRSNCSSCVSSVLSSPPCRSLRAGTFSSASTREQATNEKDFASARETFTAAVAVEKNVAEGPAEEDDDDDEGGE